MKTYLYRLYVGTWSAVVSRSISKTTIEGATLLPGAGFYKGHLEPATVVDLLLVGDKFNLDSKVWHLAQTLAQDLNQDEILFTVQEVDAISYTRVGIESSLKSSS